MQIDVQILVMVRLWNRLYLYDLWHVCEFLVVESFKKMLFFFFVVEVFGLLGI